MGKETEVLMIPKGLHAIEHEVGPDLMSVDGLAGETINLAAHKLISAAHHIPTPYGRLTVPGFQLITATGTYNTTPENINDNNVATVASGNAVNQYCEILLPGPVEIREYRSYGHNNNDGSGKWKLQYLSAAMAWTDWEVNIDCRVATWSNWIAPAAGPVVTCAIRVVATVIDTGGGWGLLGEVEVRY